jgi:hypothetical protein
MKDLTGSVRDGRFSGLPLGGIREGMLEVTLFFLLAEGTGGFLAGVFLGVAIVETLTPSAMLTATSQDLHVGKRQGRHGRTTVACCGTFHTRELG